MTSMQPLEHVSFDKPDEVRQGENWRMELVNLAGGAQVGRITLQPGWKWSQDVKAAAGTDLCMAPHQQYQVSGTIHVMMADSTELDIGPGEIASLPPGHDAWVVGDETVVAVDWQGASVWAARHSRQTRPVRDARTTGLVSSWSGRSGLEHDRTSRGPRGGPARDT